VSSRHRRLRLARKAVQFILRGKRRRAFVFATLSSRPDVALRLAGVIAPVGPELVVRVRSGQLAGTTFGCLLPGEALPVAEESMEPAVLARLERLDLEGMDAIDVGSSYGYYAVFLSRRVGDRGRVCALEPDQDSFARLTKNLRQNQCHNTWAVPAAASDAVGVASFTSNPNEPWLGRLSVEGGGLACSRDRIVPCVTVDAIVDAAGIRPVLVKIDVEGSELQVLVGSERTASAVQPHFLIEVHSPSAMSAVVSWSEERDYLAEVVEYSSDDRQHVLLKPRV
jgi:FkbM family methyltransferase